MLTFADSHVHLDRYSAAEGSALLQRAGEAGVAYFLTVGVDLASSEQAVLLAQAHAGLYAAVGWHPLYLGPGFSLHDQTRLYELARQYPEAVAIGETGIDLAEAQAPLELQQQAFHLQVQVAQRLGLPLILHQQKAESYCQDILKAAGAGKGVIVHYFVSDLASACRWLELGCTLSVGKPVTRPENIALRKAVAAIPLERLLLETDTYPLPGRTTEPADVRQVAEAVAALKDIPLETVAEQTTANFCRLLRIERSL
jgi:TatD DNase family protein